MNIVILAAGQGKRMRSALPKVLHPVAGRPMLGRVIDTARDTAAAMGSQARIVVVVGHGADDVRTRFAQEPDLHFALQSPQLGTGHAVMQALPFLDDASPTLVLYGDVPLVRSRSLVNLVALAAGGVAVLSVQLPDPTGYGRLLRGPDGSVQAIVEERDATPQQRGITEVNTGILVAPTRELRRWLAALGNQNAQGEYYLTDVVAAARAEGRSVAACCATDVSETLGVNSKAQLAQLERLAQARVAAELLEAGVTLADPQRIDVRGRLSAGNDVSIDVGCVFEGEVSLGDGVTVGPYCVLRDCTVGAGTRLDAYTHIDRAQVGQSVVIGPFARLRPGTQLDDEVHVGNFVEIKASHLGRGTKANHLSYVGDAQVGERTNVGAGTIFANYDGVNSNVLIGSNCVLIAPITVGDGATIGAGSAVSRAVPGNALTVVRARQATLPGWQRPGKKPAS